MPSRGCPPDPQGGLAVRGVVDVCEGLVVVASTDVRPKITLACESCKHRNYITKKNRRNDPDRVELKKFCPNCKTHKLHKETR
ncbi:hypothetical protein Aglo03_64100 [Actinokineospora globicatena]|uniref:Large ribosomal subunit protein bL33 n=1 Tax=Actinokineospora globicatena TaxID=103729 RepID=A0A9W6QVX7_9PSEU|nr:hypothetical protein Aglo03_64100 [Actinokineospora globicatena]